MAYVAPFEPTQATERVSVPEVPQAVAEHEDQAPELHEYVTQAASVQLSDVEGSSALLQLEVATLTPSERKHVFERVATPVPQLTLHAPKLPLCQLYVQLEVLVQLSLDAGSLDATQ